MLLLLVLAGGVWLFAELADEVVEGETQRIDRAVLLSMRNPDNHEDPRGPAWLEQAARDITALGGVAVLTIITIAAAAFALLRGTRRLALFLLLAAGGGQVVSHSLKLLFDRPRPDLVVHGDLVETASFPSGHSMLSATVYLTLGVLLARGHRQKRIKGFFVAMALFLAGIVGITRVYLGVHWPTDVLAGWTAGATWAVLCWLLARWLQRRGELSPELPANEELQGEEGEEAGPA